MIRQHKERIFVLFIWMCSILVTINLVKKNAGLVQESKNLSGDNLEITNALEDVEVEDDLKKKSKKVFQKQKSSTVSFCYCNQVSLPSQEHYQEEITKKLDWLNLTVLEHLSKHHPNFPTTIMPFLMESRCHLIPPPHMISWSNVYWQTVHVEETTFFLYSAYIDNRPLTEKRPIVRIVAQIGNMAPKAPWCYLWFNASGPPVVSPITRIEKMPGVSRDELALYAYFMKCRVPQEEAYRKPLAVSVVEKPCMEANNILEVIGAMERNNATAYREGKPPSVDDGISGFNVAACSKMLYYYQNDFSTRLVEWLEILRAIGFSKVFLYQVDVHPNISKVLQHYEEDGLVGVTKDSIPGSFLNEPSLRRLAMIASGNLRRIHLKLLNSDCILRHMHEYRFMAVMDYDEIPMILQHDSYISWMDHIIKAAATESAQKKKPMPGSYGLKWRFHYSDLPPSDGNRNLPKYLWNLRHSKVRRNPPPGTGKNVKSLYDMDTVVQINAHRSKRCSSPRKCRQYNVPPSQAYTGHYKGICGKFCSDPEQMEDVKFLVQHKDQIEEAVTKVLKKLELI